jgi:hypothetical protein
MSGPDLGRDVDPPAPPSSPPAIPDGLVFGIHFEELYFDIGEGFRLWSAASQEGLGVRPLHNEHKATQVRAALWGLAGATDLVARFDDLRDRLLRTEHPETYRDEKITEHGRLERDFDLFMRDVRQALTGPAGNWFDAGVFLARFHLCASIVQRPPDRLGADWGGIYRRELTRVAPSLDIALTAAQTTPQWAAAPLALRRRVEHLRAHLEAWDGGSAAWSGRAREYADAVFGAIGMTYGGQTPLAILNDYVTAAEQPAEPAIASDPEPAGGEPALDEASRLLDTARTDPAAAETGLRALIRATRRRLGPHHPVVYLIQTNLCLTLLALDRVDLAADLALDTSDEAEEHLGTRHPVSALAAIHATRLLLIAGRADEAAELAAARVQWLARAEPGELSHELATVREHLIDPRSSA